MTAAPPGVLTFLRWISKPPSGIQVSTSPLPQQTAQFTAVVTNATNTAVTWSGEPAVGTISAAGLYTAPSSITVAQTVTVRATSVEDTSKFDTATVQLSPTQVVQVSVTGPNGAESVTLTASQTAQFTAVVTGTANTAVTWSRDPAVGEISTSGLYTAPSTINTAQTVTVRGTSVADTSKSDTATVQLQPVVAVSVSGPGGATTWVGPGQTAQFTAVVTGTLNTAVTWEVDPVVGSISETGLYTAPPYFSSQQTITVRARSVADTTKTGTAQVIFDYTPPASMTISPTGGSATDQIFTLTVTDTHGAQHVDLVQVNFNTAANQFLGGCLVQFNTVAAWAQQGFPFADSARIQLDGSGWSSFLQLGTASGWTENSQCRLLAAGSSVTRSGNTLTVVFRLRFKPGFVGTKNIYMLARNVVGAETNWEQKGTWNLTGNAAALAPSVTIQTPASGATVTGNVLISGWALDNTTRIENGIAWAEVYIDNQLIGYATLGRPHTICGTYPDRTGCPNVGFEFTWNSSSWLNGSHTIKVIAYDSDYQRKSTAVTRNVTVTGGAAPLTVTPSPVWVRMRYDLQTAPKSYEQQQFTALVSGSPVTDVNWTLTPAPGWSTGSLSTAGLYVAPSYWYNTAGAALSVGAQRQSNPQQQGTAYLYLMGIMAPPVMTLYSGQTVFCYADVALTDYQLTPSTGAGTITSVGWYTAPNPVPYPMTVRVTARAAAGGGGGGGGTAYYMTEITLLP